MTKPHINRVDLDAAVPVPLPEGINKVVKVNLGKGGKAIDMKAFNQNRQQVEEKAPPLPPLADTSRSIAERYQELLDKTAEAGTQTVEPVNE